MMGFAVLVILACAARAESQRPCSPHFTVPVKPPSVTTEYNGIQLQDVCIETPDLVHTVHVIGDWGGHIYETKYGEIVAPADRRSYLFGNMARKFVHGVDNKAQTKVAEQMKLRAQVKAPGYALQVGDMFYWTGVDGQCGGPPVVDQMSSQFTKIFENVYDGPLASTPFLGILGNHDYGGNKFTSAWQETIGYTWGGNMPRTRRWFIPALYWAQRVRYPGFSVDYLFVDTNTADSGMLCGALHNGQTASCGNQGPQSLMTCNQWFWTLWSRQWDWITTKLSQAQDSTFQIVVTHYPPSWFQKFWSCMAARFGIDVFIGGHTHIQLVHAGASPGNPVKGGTCTVISGGGGGITSEGMPSIDGNDDQYGFMELQLSKEKIRIAAISHGGKVRSITTCPPRNPNPGVQCTHALAARRLQEEVEANVTLV